MYQSIRILQLVCPIYRAPHRQLCDKKGHLQLATKVQKRWNWNLFFVTTWISSKFNLNGKRHVLPTLIQFHVHRTSIVKVTFNRNSGERLAPDTQFTAASWKGPPACPGSAHTSCLSSWTPAQHSVTDVSYKKCMWQATRDGNFGSRQCLVLVAWPWILLFRVARIGVKQNFRVSASTFIYAVTKA